MISEAIDAKSLKKGPGWCIRDSSLLQAGKPSIRSYIFGRSKRFFSPPERLDRLRDHPPSYSWAMGVTRPELETDHSLLSSAEVKKGCIPHIP